MRQKTLFDFGYVKAPPPNSVVVSATGAPPAHVRRTNQIANTTAAVFAAAQQHGSKVQSLEVSPGGHVKVTFATSENALPRVSANDEEMSLSAVDNVVEACGQDSSASTSEGVPSASASTSVAPSTSASTSVAPAKRSNYTWSFKEKVCCYAEEHSQKEARKRYDIKDKTLQAWMAPAARDYIKRMAESTRSDTLRNRDKSKYGDLFDRGFQLYLSLRERRHAVPISLIKAYFVEIDEEFRKLGNKSQNEHMCDFRTRYGLCTRTVNSVTQMMPSNYQELVKKFYEMIAVHVISHGWPDHIVVADETSALHCPVVRECGVVFFIIYHTRHFAICIYHPREYKLEWADSDRSYYAQRRNEFIKFIRRWIMANPCTVKAARSQLHLEARERENSPQQAHADCFLWVIWHIGLTLTEGNGGMHYISRARLAEYIRCRDNGARFFFYPREREHPQIQNEVFPETK